jgi:hypothetical protein
LTLKLLLDAGFDKWARRKSVNLSHEVIREAADEIVRGLVDARLGGFLIKKRVGRKDEGKRGGFRTIIAYRAGDRIIFLHGFAKNEDDNISDKERKVLVKLGHIYMDYSPEDIKSLVDKQLLVELEI